jgi:DNA-directed RNA polymerase subunit M/transcription elongation factor TFIIS
MEFCPKCGSLLRVHTVYGDQYQMICLNPNCHNFAGQDLAKDTVKIIVDTVEIVDTTTIPTDTTTTDTTTTTPDTTPIDTGVS